MKNATKIALGLINTRQLPTGTIDTINKREWHQIEWTATFADPDSQAQVFTMELRLADGTMIESRTKTSPGTYTEKFSGLNSDTEYLIKIKYQDLSGTFIQFEQQFVWTEKAIDNVADFYNFIGFPLGTGFAIKKVGEDKNFGKASSGTDAYWRDSSSPYYLPQITAEEDTPNNRFGFQKPDGLYFGDCCRSGGKANWSSGFADFSDWKAVVADENAKTFYIFQDDSSFGKYIKDGSTNNLIYQGTYDDRIEFEVISYKKELATLADFESHFGSGIKFKLYFIDNNDEKWYVKNPTNENYDNRFVKDVAEAWEMEAWDDAGSLAMGAKDGGPKTFHISWHDFIHQWNRSECNENHCKFKVWVDTATNMFAVEELQKTQSDGTPIDDYFDNVAQEVSPNDFKCGFTNDKKYKWGLEII